MSEVELWLNSNVFYFGVVHAHPKLSFTYLKKVVTYAKSKGKDGGYPELSWNIWKHMAVNKMLMQEDLAWAYYEMFHTLMDLSPKRRLELAEMQQQSFESGDADLYRQHMAVPTLPFVLFLFIQQANKLSLRKSLLGDEWPGASPRSSDSGLLSSKADSSSNTLNEKKHTQFFLTHFSEIVEVLSEGFKGQHNSSIDLHVDLEVVEALGFIVKGRIVGQTSVYSINDLAVRHRLQAKSGYLKTMGYFSLHTFESWFRKSMSDNPYGVVNCFVKGIHLRWTHDVSDATRKKPKVISNSSFAPSNHKVVIFSQCSNQTIARQSDMISGAYVKLHKCYKCNFYILSPLKCVTAEKCFGSVFVLGPISTCVKLINCSNVTIVTPCRSVVVSGCSDITLYVTTPTHPLIANDNVVENDRKSVVLAPYSTFYADLENHLAAVGLVVSRQTDKWNKPICLGKFFNHSALHAFPGSLRSISPRSLGAGDVSRTEDSEDCCFSIMKPSDFYLITIPFKTKTTASESMGQCLTTEIPGGLPHVYAEAVHGKQRATERWRRAVKESSLSREEKKQFQILVEEQFKQWMHDSGNQKQLDNLGKQRIFH